MTWRSPDGWLSPGGVLFGGPLDGREIDTVAEWEQVLERIPETVGVYLENGTHDSDGRLILKFRHAEAEQSSE